MSSVASRTPPFERHPLVQASPWLEAPTLEGDLVVLEELRPGHATELFYALDDAAVWQYLNGAQPRSPEEMSTYVAGILREAALGRRTAWAYRDPRTSALIGTSSYMPPEEKLRSVHIGGTITARRYWHSGVNTQAKLLLLTRAFETLGAVRAEWQTDTLNLRSQAAIERLGAKREGVLRKHKPRRDGSFRDSIFYGLLDTEWPAAKEELQSRLEANRPGSSKPRLGSPPA